jgi:anti-sigma regulatory factor (Ser/Thr protein kinase)
MNAMEHGNKYDPDLPVTVRVVTGHDRVTVQIVDQGGGLHEREPVQPDIEAKLAGLQSPRGWGLFLIKNMVDEAHETVDGRDHTLELLMYLAEQPDSPEPPHTDAEEADDDDR